MVCVRHHADRHTVYRRYMGVPLCILRCVPTEYYNAIPQCISRLSSSCYKPFYISCPLEANKIVGHSGQAIPIHSRLMAEVKVCREKLEVVPSFCYLWDYLSAGGGCEFAIITRCCVAWGKFNELLPVRNPRSFPITSRWRVYNSCVSRAMFRASVTWARTLSDMHRLQFNDSAMIRWMCGVITKDQVSLQDHLERMQLDDLAKSFPPADSDGTAM